MFVANTIQASRLIISRLQTRQSSLFTRYAKGAGGDISIGADLLSEEIFATYLSPMAHIDSEESGLIRAQSATKDTPTIVLDPLDGSDNYCSGIPYYGASLALCDSAGEVLEAAVVNFCTAEVIYDHKDAPHARKINLFTQEESSLSPTQAKCGVFEKSYAYPDLAKQLYAHKLKFRSLGASALSLAYALEHKFFIFGGAIRKYDALAGLFICRNLEIARGEEVLLVSQNKQVFGMIEQILSKHHIKQD